MELERKWILYSSLIPPYMYVFDEMSMCLHTYNCLKNNTFGHINKYHEDNIWPLVSIILHIMLTGIGDKHCYLSNMAWMQEILLFLS